MSTDAYLDESLPIKSIKPAKNTVRDHEIASRKDNTIIELASSIRQHGLLQAIIVRTIEDGFEIVAGNRRFEACRLLHWKYIPAKVKELSEKDAFELQLIENIQRLTMNPMEEARAFKKYTTEFGWGGESELARTISKSEQYVSNRIQLLRLPKEIIDEISENKLKVSHALELVNLDNAEQKIVNEAILSENLSVRDIREVTRFSKPNKRNKAKSLEQDYDTNSSQIFSSAKVDPIDDSIRQQVKLLRKAQLCLKISLYRLDNLIHESGKKLYAEDYSAVNRILMDYRLRIHSMIDENIGVIRKLNKKLR